MQLVANKLSIAVEDLFSNEIEYTNYRIKSYLSQQDVIPHDEMAFMDCLHTLLEYHVWRLCYKTFVYEFHEYRESISFPVDPLSSEAFNQYVSLIDKKLINKWFTKYGLLKQMVTQTVNNTCSFIEEVCKNFSEDATLLLSKGLINRGSKLQAINPLDSDPHNNSKVILCFEFESDKKVLYKPRSLEIDVLIDRLFSEILKFGDLQNYSPVPLTVNRGGYGWQRFVHHTPINHSDLGKSYYNLGLCASVFSSIGATDLHDENIIFDGVFPYFVDLETSIQPAYSRECNKLHELMEETLTDSIAGTSIIPAKLLTIPHNTLIGAINTPYPQKSKELVFSLKNPETDAIDIAKDNVSIDKTSVPIMLIDEQVPDPLPFQKDFLKGYSDGYEKVLGKQKQIQAIFSDIKCSIRIVMRPTTKYFQLLDACLFPENLVDEYAINQVLKYLKPPSLVKDSREAKKILEEEIRSLRNGDIPYLTVNANERHVRSGDFTSNKIFDISPKNNIKRRLDKLSQKRLLFDKRLIAEGYSEIRIHEAEYKKVKDLGYQSPLFSSVLRKMTKSNPIPLIELIASLAIITEADQAEAGWLGGIYGDNFISYASNSLISLHDTGGILFLWEHLSEYSKLSNRSEYNNLFYQAKRGLKSLRSAYSSQFESAHKSIISGDSCFDFIFNHNKKRVREIEQVASEIQSQNVSNSDVFMGPIGMALMLASFSDTPNHILKKLEHDIFDETLFLSSDGIAHGNLGLIWTKFRLSFALNNMDNCKRFLKEALEISFPNTINATGWCNGNAGLLMVLSEMSEKLNEQLDLYDIAHKSMELPSNGPIDLSICHGAAGVLQSLLFTYEALENPYYLSLANQYWETVLNLANANGFYTGEKNRDYLLGYFLGWSGVADSAVLLEMYNNGDSPWVPLNLSSVSYQHIRRSESAVIGSN